MTTQNTTSEKEQSPPAPAPSRPPRRRILPVRPLGCIGARSSQHGPLSALRRAANHQADDNRPVAALNARIVPAEGEAPEWIELIPAGREVVGFDGRRWINDAPEKIVAAHNTAGLDLPVDWEHASELQAPQGLPAPAAGWIKELQARADGSIWGRVEWTERGRASVAGREYRYISPVIMYEPATTAIRAISSAALANRPNLRLPALNSQTQQTGEDAMWKNLLKKLGLAEEATEEQAINAVQKIQGDLATALNRAETPPLEKFVPRADYDAALSRATNAEQALSEKQAADLEADITREVDAALKAGKITPATKDYYTGMCRQQNGLEEFKKFVAAAPVIGDPSKMDGSKPPEQGKALNAQEQEVLERLGVSPEEYARAAV